MGQVHREAATVPEDRRQPCCFGRPDVPAGAAAGAVQVAVLGLGQHVVLLATIRPMRVTDQAQLLQHIERPIHRGRDGRGVLLAAALHQLGACDMAVGPRQDIHEHPSLWGPAQATGTQLLAGVRPRTSSGVPVTRLLRDPLIRRTTCREV